MVVDRRERAIQSNETFKYVLRVVRAVPGNPSEVKESLAQPVPRIGHARVIHREGLEAGDGTVTVSHHVMALRLDQLAPPWRESVASCQTRLDGAQRGGIVRLPRLHHTESMVCQRVVRIGLDRSAGRRGLAAEI